jgi:hypothetical protein
LRVAGRLPILSVIAIALLLDDFKQHSFVDGPSAFSAQLFRCSVMLPKRDWGQPQIAIWNVPILAVVVADVVIPLPVESRRARCFLFLNQEKPYSLTGRKIPLPVEFHDV